MLMVPAEVVFCVGTRAAGFAPGAETAVHLNCVLPSLVVRCVILHRCRRSIDILWIGSLISSSKLVYYLPSFVDFLPPGSLPKLLLGCSGVRIGISPILVLDLFKPDVVVLDSRDLHEVILELP